MRLARRIFLHNAGLKLLSLGLSFSLWASYTSEPVAEKVAEVPLVFAGIPPGLTLADDAPAAARAVVRGRESLTRRITPGDLAVRIDLSGAAEGETRVLLAPAMVGAPSGTQVIRISPAVLSVRLVASEAALAEPE